MFTIIRRAFKYLNAETFIPLYKSLVRLQLDYASSVWAPYRNKHISPCDNKSANHWIMFYYFLHISSTKSIRYKASCKAGYIHLRLRLRVNI